MVRGSKNKNASASQLSASSSQSTITIQVTSSGLSSSSTSNVGTIDGQDPSSTAATSPTTTAPVSPTNSNRAIDRATGFSKANDISLTDGASTTLIPKASGGNQQPQEEEAQENFSQDQ
jgi:hypothetical protein